MSCETTLPDDLPQKPKFSVPRWVDRIFLLVGLGLLVFVVTRFPFSDVLAACIRVGPVIAATPLLALGWLRCNAAGLYTLLGGRVPFRVLLWNRLVGDGYNALLPLGGFGGEPFKLRHLSAFVPPEQALTAMLRDRLTENAVGFAFSAIWLTLGVSRFAHGRAPHMALLTYAVSALLASFCYATVLTTRLPGRLGAAATRWLGMTGEAVAPIALGRLVVAASFYLLGRCLGLVEVTALFALLGMPLDPVTIGFAYSALQAVGFISFLIPQGLGVLEGTSTWLFALLGFPGALGVAFVFARRGRLLVVSLLGVLLHVGARATSAAQPGQGGLRS